MTPPHTPGIRPETPATPLSTLLGRTVLLTTAATVALVLPAPALLATALLGLFVGAVTRVGLWILDEHPTRAATALAVRAGAGAAGAALGVAGLALLLGPATPEVVATAIAVTLLYLATTRGTAAVGVR